MADPNKLYKEYSSGLMNPDRKSLYERAIQAGQLQLPEGVTELGQPVANAQIPATPQSPVVAEPPIQKPNVIQAGQTTIDVYKSGGMDPKKKELFERGVRSGQIQLPENEQGLVADPSTEEPTFIEGITEQITGAERSTPEIESLPDWYQMPEIIGDVTKASFKNVIALSTAGPDESKNIMVGNNPGVTARKDEKGNWIFKSAIDGKEYGRKPGFRPSDFRRGVVGAGMFAMTKGKGLLAKMGGAAAVQTGIEGVQKAAGGEFDVEQIPLAGATEVLGAGAGKILTGAKGALKRGPSAAQTAVKEAEKVGIQPLTSDVIPPKTFAGKMGQAVTERIPVVGTGPVRVAQQTDRVAAIRGVLRDFGADEMNDASDLVMKDLLKKRGAYITKYTTNKKEVIERLSGGNAQSPVLVVPVDNTNQAIKEGIEELSKRRTTESQKAINVLTEYGDAFQKTNLSAIEELRKELGNKLRSPDMATARTTSEKQLSKVYTAINEDMGDFIKKTGDKKDFVKWKVANKRLSNMIGELKSSTLKTVLNKGDVTPEVVKKMLFSQKPSEIRLLYKGLTPDGKKAAKVALLQKAVEKSGGIDILSTAKFQTNLGKLQKSTGIMFSGEDKKVLNGLMKALEITKRSEVASFKPATGAELTTFAAPTFITYLLGGEPMVGLTATAGIGGLARVYESRPVRNALLQLAKGRPGIEHHLMNKLTTALQVSKQQIKTDKKEQ